MWELYVLLSLSIIHIKGCATFWVMQVPKDIKHCILGRMKYLGDRMAHFISPTRRKSTHPIIGSWASVQERRAHAGEGSASVTFCYLQERQASHLSHQRISFSFRASYKVLWSMGRSFCSTSSPHRWLILKDYNN